MYSVYKPVRLKGLLKIVLGLVLVFVLSFKNNKRDFYHDPWLVNNQFGKKRFSHQTKVSIWMTKYQYGMGIGTVVLEDIQPHVDYISNMFTPVVIS